MKIQIVSWRDPKNPKAGGAEVCLVEIARRLMARYGHEVSWFAPEFEGGSRTDEHEGIRIEREGRFSLVHVHAWKKLFAKRRQTADFYIEDYHGVTLGLSWILDKPGVVFVHEVAGPIWMEMWRPPLSLVGYALEKASLRLLKKTTFIAVSPSTKTDLVAHGIPSENVYVITEGSDIERVATPRPKKERERAFVFVGRICTMKKVDVLVQAFAKHRALVPDTRLVLVGSVDEGFEAELRGMIRELGIEGAVEIAGRVSQERKKELLGSSLALVSCSMREGFGLIVVEAASQGTPSLTFDVNGYRDIVEKGKNGFTAPYPDEAALARLMRDVAEMDEASYDALARSSLEASRKYSWDETAAQVNRILEVTADRRA